MSQGYCVYEERVCVSVCGCLRVRVCVSVCACMSVLVCCFNWVVVVCNSCDIYQGNKVRYDNNLGCQVWSKDYRTWSYLEGLPCTYYETFNEWQKPHNRARGGVCFLVHSHYLLVFSSAQFQFIYSVVGGQTGNNCKKDRFSSLNGVENEKFQP